MNRFDHVMVMVSIVIGLGVTQLLTDFSTLIINHHQIRQYVPHTVWAIFAFALLIQFWWAIWLYYDIPDQQWNYVDYIIVLLAATFLYLVSELVLPKVSNEPIVEIDFKEYFGTVSFYLFSCLSSYLMLVIILRKRVRKISFDHRSNVIRYVALICSIIGIMISIIDFHNELMDMILALIGLFIMTIFLWYFNPYRL